ncbi:MAG TPA: A24 family peptidase [Solirubrobacterales bacterium]|nr:A24 family peptidase [Solirubrobacterales bacterium]
MLATVSVIDLRERRVPNRVLGVAVALGLSLLAVADPSSVPGRLAVALLAGGAFLALALLRPDGFGMGDVKLIGVMGFFLGVGVLTAIMVALLSASLLGLVLFVRDGRAAAKATIPFAPLLALGGVLALLAAPSPAAAAIPDTGHFAGHDGVGFDVGRSDYGTPTIDKAEFHTTYSGSPRAIKTFPQAFARDGYFETCGRYGHVQVIFWEYCIGWLLQRSRARLRGRQGVPRRPRLRPRQPLRDPPLERNASVSEASSLHFLKWEMACPSRPREKD